MIVKNYDNYQIFIGKNKHENDDLIKSSSPNDIWFHLEDYSSPHVVVKLKDTKLTKKIIVQASLFVKENSKYKSQKNVTVIWCKIENIILTNIPGNVIIRNNNYKTIQI